MPLLAKIDVATVFTAVFLIVMFLGWVMQAVQGQNQQQGPVRRGQGGKRSNGPGGQQRPPRPRDDRVRSEIDAFLEEVDAPVRDRDRERGPVIEIVEPPRPPRERPVRPQPAREQATPSQRRPRPERRSRPVAQEPPRPAVEPVPAELGTALTSHVTTYMDSHIDNDVATHLPHLQSNVGARPSESASSMSQSASAAGSRPAAHPLITVLRNPAGVRQAILLGEILNRPRILRRDD